MLGSPPNGIKALLSRFKIPLFLLVGFWILAVVLWLSTGKIFYLVLGAKHQKSRPQRA